MPPSHHHQSLSDPNYEAKIQNAIDGLHNGTYKNKREAAAVEGVCLMTLFIIFHCIAKCH